MVFAIFFGCPVRGEKKGARDKGYHRRFAVYALSAAKGKAARAQKNSRDHRSRLPNLFFPAYSTLMI